MTAYEYIIYSYDMKEKGHARLDEELSCRTEGCNGNQYVVEWEDDETKEGYHAQYLNKPLWSGED